jgi:hypothetical protein
MRCPAKPRTSVIRRSWRQAVFKDGKIDGPAYELCLFAELRDRLGAGDIWVAGSRQYRAVEDRLIARPLFAAMKEAGPLPVTIPLDCTSYLAQRRNLLQDRLQAIAAKASQDRLEDDAYRIQSRFSRSVAIGVRQEYPVNES